ncbi:K+/H+ antiporter subunit F [Candidatus Tokpelaia sp.]|uniref:K+/H+ antiporter subunit F n=1 Tax=Candidatus Tokpelaia sp. TaxID=2233777 RepID=UPI00123BF74F|nr:K+/H+ antiporter subunit F [Candidatus Tokpelaia sp.]KAA6404595.1 K+/H+ antiporter subunit F [Candidatus Tokpelaia sp.]
MSLTILIWGVFAARLLLACSCLLLSFRLIKGPKAQDRIIGLDTLYVIVMMLFATFTITTNSRIYFETALIIAMIGFVSTIALAKFLMRGEVIE